VEKKMHSIKINGGNTLSGTISIGGAKNSIVALIPGAILTNEEVNISNVPDISDVKALENILKYLNVDYSKKNDIIKIKSKDMVNKEITKNMSSKLRASYYFMGSMLSRYKHVEISMPGGCTIGNRPIDLHLKGFKALGATITETENKVIIDAEELKGNKIYLDFASVGATINIMYAAVMAKGKTIIENAAKEPEIVNVATFLNNMGARIKGAGTEIIKIVGVEKLHSCFTEVIPDRIEAGTYIIMGAALGDKLKIENIIPQHISTVLEKLEEMGAEIEVNDDYVIISKVNKLKATSIKTLVYPGFPTDLQQVFASLMCIAKGQSTIKENIYENRFNNLFELIKMGANIEVNGNKAIIKGPNNLSGCEVNATDLRAGAGLVVAALIASGETTINNADYILRGYEHIVKKISSIGGEISLL
jgi:UDP-N-acetylglucosamine 1-carboxyvinyltransferase